MATCGVWRSKEFFNRSRLSSGRHAWLKTCSYLSELSIVGNGFFRSMVNGDFERMTPVLLSEDYPSLWTGGKEPLKKELYKISLRIFNNGKQLILIAYSVHVIRTRNKDITKKVASKKCLEKTYPSILE